MATGILNQANPGAHLPCRNTRRAAALDQGLEPWQVLVGPSDMAMAPCQGTHRCWGCSRSRGQGRAAQGGDGGKLRNSCDHGAVLRISGWWGLSVPGAVLCLLRPPPSLSIPVDSSHHRQRQPRRLWENEAIPWRSLAGDFAAQSAPAAQSRGDGARSGRTDPGGCPHWAAAGAGPRAWGAVRSLYRVWG